MINSQIGLKSKLLVCFINPALMGRVNKPLGNKGLAWLGRQALALKILFEN